MVRKNDDRDALRLYKKWMREEMLEFGDPSAVERKLTKHEQKTDEQADATDAGDIPEAARMDAREEDCRKWKAYHRNIRRDHAKAFKAYRNGYSGGTF